MKSFDVSPNPWREGDQVEFPDGYTPNGKARPWRKATVIEVNGRYVRIKDTNGQIQTAPYYTIRSCGASEKQVFLQ